MPNKFATAINCMDGRVQRPVAEYMQKVFGVEYIDMITEPGPVKILSDGTDMPIIESLKKRAGISVERHYTRVIAIVAHYDCLANPVDVDVQKEQLRKAVDVILSWGFPVEKIIALWVDENFTVSVTGNT